MPESAYILSKTLLPVANDREWLNIDLSTARTNISLGKEGISIATSDAWIGTATFTLKLKSIINTYFEITGADFKQMPVLDGYFKDILITNPAQPGISIKFAVFKHIN